MRSPHASIPNGDGRYNIEYRVIGRNDGVTRHIATSGRTIFEHAAAVDFIGAAIDVTAQRRAEAAIRASEEQFRSFAEHSSSLIWISATRRQARSSIAAVPSRRSGARPARKRRPTSSEWMNVGPSRRPPARRTRPRHRSGRAMPPNTNTASSGLWTARSAGSAISASPSATSMAR